MKLFKLIYSRECQGYVAVQWVEYNHCNVSIDYNLSNFCLNCENVVQTTWTKIVLKIASLGLKISPKAFAAGAPPGPHWGSLQRSPRPLAGFRGPLHGGGRGKGNGEGREGRGEEGEGSGRGRRRGGSLTPPSSFMLIPTLRGSRGKIRLFLMLMIYCAKVFFTSMLSTNKQYLTTDCM